MTKMGRWMAGTALGLGSALAPAAFAGPAAAQLRVEAEPVHRFGGPSVAWAGVNDADATDSLLVVASSSEPFLHLFRLADGELLKSWGSQGEGPGEFREAPTSVALVGGTVYAVDLNQQQLEVFDATSDSAATIRMDALGLTLPAYVSRLERTGNVLLLRPMDPMGRGALVVAWRGEEGVLDTLANYERPPRSIRLDGPPTFPVPQPFAIGPLWTSTPRGVAYYPGDGATHLEEITLDGSAASQRDLSFGDSYRAADSEREWWMDQHIPQEFAGRRGVFDAVRSQAREMLDFPSHLPPVLDLMGGSGRDVWVLRRPVASGQTWDVVDASGELSGRVELPAGSRLVAVLTDRVVVIVADELGVETVQVHRLHAGLTGTEGR